jgi:hypothetical protein
MRRWSTTLALAAIAALATTVAPSLQPPPGPPRPRPAVAPAPSPPEPAPPWVSLAWPPPGQWNAPAPVCRSAPFGPDAVLVLQAAREGRCGDALDLLSVALDASPDHCSLVPEVWGCFQEDAAALIHRGAVVDFDELAPLLAHLEGDRAVRARAELRPERIALPVPYLPAPDGLEKLLRVWEDDPRIRALIDDRYGPGVVADKLGGLLVVEARILTGLVRLPPERRGPWVDDVAARRAYVLGRSLGGPLAERLYELRPEHLATVREAVAEAERSGSAAVRDALATARIRQ